MDKQERETHDFMSVESFSQLPFIRPSATPVKEKGIRLFGKDFGAGGGGGGGATAGEEANEAESGGAGTANPSEEVKDNGETNNGESNRRFECHYCCRNFPTSQALGGHQNAHKRERQHAKRAHLQSAMVQGSLSDAHVYGFMNYRLSSTPTYPSWNSNAGGVGVAGNGRFYGSHGSSFSHQPPPINGNPLAFWRIPSAQSNNFSYSREHSLHSSLPRFSTEDFRPPQGGGSGGQSRFVYESKSSVQDHVSLDLHL